MDTPRIVDLITEVINEDYEDAVVEKARTLLADYNEAKGDAEESLTEEIDTDKYAQAMLDYLVEIGQITPIDADEIADVDSVDAALEREDEDSDMVDDLE